jgi:hypothetical protein
MLFYHHVIFFRQQKTLEQVVFVGLMAAVSEQQTVQTSGISKAKCAKYSVFFSSLCHCCNAYCGQQKSDIPVRSLLRAYDYSGGRNYTAQALTVTCGADTAAQ